MVAASRRYNIKSVLGTFKKSFARWEVDSRFRKNSMTKRIPWTFWLLCLCLSRYLIQKLMVWGACGGSLQYAFCIDEIPTTWLWDSDLTIFGKRKIVVLVFIVDGPKDSSESVAEYRDGEETERVGVAAWRGVQGIRCALKLQGQYIAGVMGWLSE